PIKKSSVSDDSSSEMMELEDSVLVADPQLESSMRRLREEERLILEQQAAMEAAGTTDDIAKLEQLDLLRHNQLRQIELLKRQAKLAKRATPQEEPEVRRRHTAGRAALHEGAHGSCPGATHGAICGYGTAYMIGHGSSHAFTAAHVASHGSAHGSGYDSDDVAVCGPTCSAGLGGARCTVRVNRLHAAAATAFETDV
ncbi:jg17934, partial [Pararge aegeria aegeria]